MPANPGRRTTDGSKNRISVTFTPEQYEALVEQANIKKVSVAWVVRDAVDQYLQSESPLFYREGLGAQEN